MLGEVLPAAAQHLSAAVEARQRLTQRWSDLLAGGLVEELAVTDPNGVGRIAVRTHWPDDARAGLTGDLQQCLDELWACLDAVVVGSVSVVSILAHPNEPDRDRFFPVADSVEGFDALLDEACLDGVLAAQQQIVADCQPFRTQPSDPAAIAARDAVRRLLEWTSALEDGALVGAWVTPVEPQVEVGANRELLGLTVSEPRPLAEDETVVATYRVSPGIGGVAAKTGSYVDMAPTTGWSPAGVDDTFDGQLKASISGVALVAGLFARLLSTAGPLPPMSVPSTDDASTWTSADEMVGRWSPEDLDALRDSEWGVGVVRDRDELMFVLSTDGGVFARRVPAVTPLNPYLRSGAAAEVATQSAAATWGLPDFVLLPETVRHGSGVREVGDGLLVVGERGVVLQVKNREASSGDPTRESSWTKKKIASAARQIHGTVRRLNEAPLVMTNGRGRAVKVDGPATAWVGVVIIDHPEPPDELALTDHSARVPVVVLLRRDWEFLFDQLRSTRAVVDYLHRVGGPCTRLGTEPDRYFELAAKDAAAPPSLADPSLTGDRYSIPLLPMEPVDHDDDPAHAVVRIVCEDIAGSTLDADEHERVSVLAALDRIPVALRTDLGRLVLEEMLTSRTTFDGAVRWRFRSYRAPIGEPQVGIGVCTTLNETTRAGFRSWVLLRHHERGSADELAGTRTIGVLLTPRTDGFRDWDTTMIAVEGDPNLDDEDLAAFRGLWNESGQV